MGKSYGKDKDGNELRTQIEKRYGIVLRRRKVEVQTRYGAKTFITEYWLGE